MDIPGKDGLAYLGIIVGRAQAVAARPTLV